MAIDAEGVDEMLAALREGGWSGNRENLLDLLRRVEDGDDRRLFLRGLRLEAGMAADKAAGKRAVERCVALTGAFRKATVYGRGRDQRLSLFDPVDPASRIVDVEVSVQARACTAINDVWGEDAIVFVFRDADGERDTERYVLTRGGDE